MNEWGDFPLYLPDEIILIIFEYVASSPTLWTYVDGHGSPETQAASAVCRNVGNFGATCRRFCSISRDHLLWKHMAIQSGFVEKVSVGAEHHSFPILVQTLAHARLLYHPQTYYKVWRPEAPFRLLLSENDTFHPRDIIQCKHVIPPTASEVVAPTEDFYRSRATYEHQYFPARCFVISYATYVSTTRNGSVRRMQCYSNQQFYQKFLHPLKISDSCLDSIFKELREKREAVFSPTPGLWITVRRMDLLQKMRKPKVTPPVPRKKPTRWHPDIPTMLV